VLRFRLFGFPITVQPWHWLVLAFLSGGLMHINDRETLAYVLMFVVAGFLSILIHELGHAFTSRRFGCRRVEIVMHGMGGVAISHNPRFTRGQHIWISIAGPAVQILAGILVFFFFWKGFIPDTPVQSLLASFMAVSFFWALINLLPVYPLDGGQILWHALGPRQKSLTLRISMFTAVAVGIFLFLWLKDILFPIILGFMACQNYKMLIEPTPRRPW
jgi:Zn-dependent protease